MTMTPQMLASLGIPADATTEEIEARLAELGRVEQKNTRLTESLTSKDGFPRAVPPHLNRAAVVARYKTMMEHQQPSEAASLMAISAEESQCARNLQNGIPYEVE